MSQGLDDVFGMGGGGLPIAVKRSLQQRQCVGPMGNQGVCRRTLVHPCERGIIDDGIDKILDIAHSPANEYLVVDHPRHAALK